MRRIWRNLEEILASALLVVLCVVVTLQVASRYLLRRPFSWTEELSGFLFVWITMLGACVALKRGEHFRVGFLADRLPAGIRRWAQAATEGAVMIVAVLLVIAGLWRCRAGWTATSPALELPMTWPYAAIPVGGALMLARAVQKATDLFRKKDTP